MSRELSIGLSVVIFSVADLQPRVLAVDAASPGGAAPNLKKNQEPLATLPAGTFDPDQDRTLELGLRNWVSRQTGQELGYVEQLYTFADEGRDPREKEGGPRMVSVAYLALSQATAPPVGGPWWAGCYQFLPWEDWREGRPAMIDEIEQQLGVWATDADDRTTRRQREERLEICFGLSDAGWDGFRALERYELLYEAGLVEEAWRDRHQTSPSSTIFGQTMAFDHRRILATGLARLRGKLRYRPVVFEMLEPEFTLNRLQRVVEALAGLPLHKQNFRRLVERGGLVEGTGRQDSSTGGRPAELFRFRREVLRERRAPGVGALAPRNLGRSG